MLNPNVVVQRIELVDGERRGGELCRTPLPDIFDLIRT